MTLEPASRRLLLGAALFVGLLSLLAWVTRPMREMDPAARARAEAAQQRAEGNDRALATCHRAAEARLKAPATARFPRGGDPGVSVGRTLKAFQAGGETVPADSYLIESFVDAQNALGALLRTRFTCAIHRDGRLLEISFAK